MSCKSFIDQKSLNRFIDKIQFTDSCWNWQKDFNRKYGRFDLYNNKEISAHRVAYEWFVGPIPENLTIDHVCKNTKCVNPDHLEIVSLQENIFRANGSSVTHCPNGHLKSEYQAPVSPSGRGRKGFYCKMCHRNTNGHSL